MSCKPSNGEAVALRQCRRSLKPSHACKLPPFKMASTSHRAVHSGTSGRRYASGTASSSRKVFFDEGGNPIDPDGRSGPELVRTILFWSALPGESRHHWGTEIDVFDRSRLPPGKAPELLPHEVAPGGAFHDLHAWRDQNIELFGFFRPYAFRKSEGSMMSELWHLSFADRSMPLLERVTPTLLMSAINGEGMAGLEHVTAMLDEIVAAHHRSNCLPTEQIAIAGAARKAPRDRNARCTRIGLPGPALSAAPKRSLAPLPRNLAHVRSSARIKARAEDHG